MMIMADKLIALRKKNGWSQEELAQQLNVSRQSVSKWEGAQSVPDLDKVLQMSRLFGVSTDYLLKDELEEAELADAGPADTPELPALRCVTMEEASAFLAVKEQTARPVALATFLCIQSPVCLMLLAAAQEAGRVPLSEDAAGGLGMAVLLVLVAVAVAVFMACDARTRQWDFLEKEPIETAYGVAGMVRERQARYYPAYTRGNILGVVLCILAVVPLFAGLCFSEEDLFLVALLALLLALAGAGAAVFIRVGIPWASMEKLLEEGDYSRRKKHSSRWMGTVSAVYWLAVTALFLLLTFRSREWLDGWVIWPVAGVLYAAVRVICAAFFEREQ